MGGGYRRWKQSFRWHSPYPVTFSTLVSGYRSRDLTTSLICILYSRIEPMVYALQLLELLCRGSSKHGSHPLPTLWRYRYRQKHNMVYSNSTGTRY